MKDENQLSNEELKDVNGGIRLPHEKETFAVGDWCREAGPTIRAGSEDEIYLVTAVSGNNLTVKKYLYWYETQTVVVANITTKNAFFFAKCNPPTWKDKIGDL